MRRLSRRPAFVLVAGVMAAVGSAYLATNTVAKSSAGAVQVAAASICTANIPASGFDRTLSTALTYYGIPGSLHFGTLCLAGEPIKSFPFASKIGMGLTFPIDTIPLQSEDPPVGLLEYLLVSGTFPTIP